MMTKNINNNFRTVAKILKTCVERVNFLFEQKFKYVGDKTSSLSFDNLQKRQLLKNHEKI